MGPVDLSVFRTLVGLVVRVATHELVKGLENENAKSGLVSFTKNVLVVDFSVDVKDILSVGQAVRMERFSNSRTRKSFQRHFNTGEEYPYCSGCGWFIVMSDKRFSGTIDMRCDFGGQPESWSLSGIC
jgi:hypothetical protein